MSQSDPNFRTYVRFGEAIAQGDTDAMRACVDEASFLALVPGATAGVKFEFFAAEMERQRAAFSDFGQHVDIFDVISDGRKLAVRTLSTVTFDGRLTGWNTDQIIQPNGRVVLIKSVDILTFDSRGRIVELIVMSDRLATINQMN